MNFKCQTFSFLLAGFFFFFEFGPVSLNSWTFRQMRASNLGENEKRIHFTSNWTVMLKIHLMKFHEHEHLTVRLPFDVDKRSWHWAHRFKLMSLQLVHSVISVSDNIWAVHSEFNHTGRNRMHRCVCTSLFLYLCVFFANSHIFRLSFVVHAKSRFPLTHWMGKS